MRARLRSDSRQDEGNEIVEHMQECEVLKDLYNKSDVPKILNFYKFTEEALKNGAEELKVYIPDSRF